MLHLRKSEAAASSSSSRSTKTKSYPTGPEFYQLFEEVGHGASACVYRALCIPFNEIVAIKILDFEHGDPNNIVRESKTMYLVDHPNVLRAYCSFASHHNIWVVMPYMDGGSCLHILRTAFPDGFRDEAVISTFLRQVLKGLDYLHQHGHIHRDVKAGNILVDTHGSIKLGDLGVSAFLFDSTDRLHMRNSLVGTPCWMAPEVMAQLYGYDFKADIWSFGITALELAHGHAPFSKHPPNKVFLNTLQNAPPGLDYERDKKFSKSFRQMIAMCLVKEPSKRPSAHKLLKHSFFKNAKSSESIVRTILEGLPALGERLESLKRKEANLLAQDGRKEELSQREYKRGISDWNFNIDDLKAEASLIQDFEEVICVKDQGSSSNSLVGLDTEEKSLECQPSTASHYLEDDDPDKAKADALQNREAALLHGGLTLKNLNGKQQIEVPNVASCKGTMAQQAVRPAPAKLPVVNGDNLDKRMEGQVVQQRGRFKVMDENFDTGKVQSSRVQQKNQCAAGEGFVIGSR